jgi:four helix bundle protein
MAERLIWSYASEGQKRPHIAHFVSKLTDANGLRLVAYASEREQAETQHWLDTAAACKYILEPEQKTMSERCSRIGRMLGAIMADPDKWCQKAEGFERKSEKPEA